MTGVTRRTVLSLWAGMVAAGCARGQTNAEEPASAKEETGMRVIRYGEHPSQFAELTLPDGTAPVPVVVVVHGGFWRTAYGAELGRPLVADLVPRGWAALNVEYRRVGRSADAGGGGWPRTCTDVAAAVDALAGQGQQEADGRLDLTRVIGLGHSAGGHLVGWLAGRPTLPREAPGGSPLVRLSGVVAQAGVLDLVGGADEDVGGGAVNDLMGGGPKQDPQAYDWASPLARVPLGIPSICVHGDTDENVPSSQSERFVAAARATGDDSELQRFTGGHFELIDTTTEAWRLCVQAVTRLLGPER